MIDTVEDLINELIKYDLQTKIRIDVPQDQGSEGYNEIYELVLVEPILEIRI